jgi:hypothetical protein
MNDEINYLVSYLKKKYCISECLQNFLLDENFTSPFSLKYINLENESLLQGDVDMVNIFLELTDEELKKMKYDMISMYKLYFFDNNKMDLALFLEKNYFISPCLKKYLEDNNYTCPYTLQYIDTSEFKQGDKNFLIYFNNFDNVYYNIINQKIQLMNHEKKYIFKYFKNKYKENNNYVMEMDID